MQKIALIFRKCIV